MVLTNPDFTNDGNGMTDRTLDSLVNKENAARAVLFCGGREPKALNLLPNARALWTVLQQNSFRNQLGALCHSGIRLDTRQKRRGQRLGGVRLCLGRLG
jgi:hypothetical protein